MDKGEVLLGTGLRLGGQNGHSQAETETWNSHFILLRTLVFVHSRFGEPLGPAQSRPGGVRGRKPVSGGARVVELREKKLGFVAPIQIGKRGQWRSRDVPNIAEQAPLLWPVSGQETEQASDLAPTAAPIAVVVLGLTAGLLRAPWRRRSRPSI